MNSIATQGIFTSQGFFSILLFALGLYFFSRLRDEASSESGRVNKWNFYWAVIFAGSGLFFGLLYYRQILIVL